MSFLHILSVIVLFEVTQCADILLQPYAYGMTSRLRDEVKMVELLTARGHHVTVLINNDDKKVMDHIEGVSFLHFPYPENGLKMNDYLIEEQLMGKHRSDMFTPLKLGLMLVNVQMSVCKQILSNNVIMTTLTQEHYDVFITNLEDPCARVVKTMLDLPTVAMLSYIAYPDASLTPQLTSMSPALFSLSPDQMTFVERFKNSVSLLALNIVILPICERAAFTFIEDEKLQLKNEYYTTFTNAMILVNSDFNYEYPRPTFPNVIPIGGWYVEPSQPLRGELNTFVERSGSSGIIYLSFGTLISKSAPQKAEMIAKVMAQFPEYSFIWKYTGVELAVPKNVLLQKWVPQNDLLGHDAMRLFITHCGIHSVYETIFHGIPVVAVPLFGDQPSNAVRLTRRLHMGVQVDFDGMTEQTFKRAMTEVLTNNTYKQHAQKAQQVFIDQHTTPKSRLLFYIEYVIRHRGAGLLESKPLAKLSLLQFYSVDVLLVLSILIVLMMTLVFNVCRICVVRVRRCRVSPVITKKEKMG